MANGNCNYDITMDGVIDSLASSGLSIIQYEQRLSLWAYFGRITPFDHALTCSFIDQLLRR